MHVCLYGEGHIRIVEKQLHVMNIGPSSLNPPTFAVPHRNQSHP